ncbi:MAG: hypothetical protein Q9163_003443 [Psora crenata]
MHYAAAIMAFALAGSSSAWWHNNSTVVPVGSASGVSPKPPTTGTGTSYQSGVPSGHGPYPSHGLGAGVSPSIPGEPGTGQPSKPTGASGSGHGASLPVTTSPPAKTTSITIPGIPSKTTKTVIITTTMTETVTKFVPCSTAVATSNGHTFYSSSLTTSMATSTVTAVVTEYTVYCPAPTQAEGTPTAGESPASAPGSVATNVPGSGSGADSSNSGGSHGDNCPTAQTVSVYITVTVPAGGPQTQAPGSPRPPYPSGDGDGAVHPSGTDVHGTGKGWAFPTGTRH